MGGSQVSFTWRPSGASIVKMQAPDLSLGTLENTTLGCSFSDRVSTVPQFKTTPLQLVSLISSFPVHFLQMGTSHSSHLFRGSVVKHQTPNLSLSGLRQ